MLKRQLRYSVDSFAAFLRLGAECWGPRIADPTLEVKLASEDPARKAELLRHHPSSRPCLFFIFLRWERCTSILKSLRPFFTIQKIQTEILNLWYKILFARLQARYSDVSATPWPGRTWAFSYYGLVYPVVPPSLLYGITENDTTSSSRVFLKILFRQLFEFMGLNKLNERLKNR